MLKIGKDLKRSIHSIYVILIGLPIRTARLATLDFDIAHSTLFVSFNQGH